MDNIVLNLLCNIANSIVVWLQSNNQLNSNNYDVLSNQTRTFLKFNKSVVLFFIGIVFVIIISKYPRSS